MKGLTKNERKLNVIECEELVEIFASTVELPLPADEELDTSSEYKLASRTEYEDWNKTIELLSEFCFYDKDCLKEMMKILLY